MNPRRLAALVAVTAPLLVTGSAPAHSTHCPPGSRLITAVPLHFPGSGSAVVTNFFATEPISGALCAEGTLQGNCPAATVLDDSSVVTLVANSWEAQSCMTGSTKFTVLAWSS